MQRILSAWAWVAAVSTVLFGFLYVSAVWLVTAPFDRGRYHAGRAFRQLAVAAVSLNPLWDFETDGEAPADPRHPYVAVSNHESYADIFLISHFPWEMKWLSKDTIFRIPVMGWMMRMAGDIPIKRGRRERTRVPAMTRAPPPTSVGSQNHSPPSPVRSSRTVSAMPAATSKHPNDIPNHHVQRRMEARYRFDRLRHSAAIHVHVWSQRLPDMPMRGRCVVAA